MSLKISRYAIKVSSSAIGDSYKKRCFEYNGEAAKKSQQI